MHSALARQLEQDRVPTPQFAARRELPGTYRGRERAAGEPWASDPGDADEEELAQAVARGGQRKAIRARISDIQKPWRNNAFGGASRLPASPAALPNVGSARAPRPQHDPTGQVRDLTPSERFEFALGGSMSTSDRYSLSCARLE